MYLRNIFQYSSEYFSFRDFNLERVLVFCYSKIKYCKQILVKIWEKRSIQLTDGKHMK